MKKLLENFSWSLLGSSIYALSQWLMVIVIARVGNPEQLGYFSLALAITAPIMLFCNLKLRTILSTDMLNEYGFNTFRTIRFYSNMFFILVILILLLILDYSFEINVIILIIAAYKIVESLNDLNYGLFQRIERLDYVAKSNIVRGVLGTGVFALVYLYFSNLSYSLFSLFIIWLLNLILIDNRKSRKISNEFSRNVDFNKHLFLIKVLLPLGLVSFISSIIVNIPRFVIEKYLSFEELGYFTTVFYLVIVIGKFMTSMGGALLPRMAKVYESKDYSSFIKYYSVINISLIFFSLVLILISILYGSSLLTIIYGSEYMLLEGLLILIMIYGLFYYLGYIAELTLDAMKKFTYRFPIEILMAIITLILSVLLIPIYSLNGAAYALIISSFIKFVILSILLLFTLNKEKKMNSNLYR